jgi:hypothetical protein
MMNMRRHTMLMAAIGLAILAASGIAATAQQKQDEMSQRMMDMSAMMNEPHHQLAMAYKENLVNFAKALHQQAADTITVNPQFARDAVGEMRRSFDQMLGHHQDHMKTMDEKMKERMADMKKKMDAQCDAIKDDLAALDKEAQTSAPDSKTISRYVDDILKNCDSMSKMHDDMKDREMAPPKEHKMN